MIGMRREEGIMMLWKGSVPNVDVKRKKELQLFVDEVMIKYLLVEMKGDSHCPVSVS